MEPELGAAQPQFRSSEMLSAFDEIRGLISGPPVTGGSSFTALLELPPPQAVELLGKEDFPAKHPPPPPPPIFPTDIGLVRRASKFSVFASADNLLEGNAILSDSNSMKLDAVKQEQLDAGSRRNSSSPAGSDQSPKSGKRKEREKKVKESNKKSKNMVANEPSDDGGTGDELPYVHVRARRGQATDSHSLAERARREKINARMKLLQEIVPGCNKVSGTAMVLDEIINHVQALQRQVELIRATLHQFLSMKLAAVSPGMDIDLDSLFPVNGASNETGYTCMFTPPIYSEGQTNGTRQLQLQQLWHSDELQQPVWATDADTSNFIAPANSLLTYDSPSGEFRAASQQSGRAENGAVNERRR